MNKVWQAKWFNTIGEMNVWLRSEAQHIDVRWITAVEDAGRFMVVYQEIT